MVMRVLVVEDDSELRDVLVMALEQEGYEVASAENGLDALVRLLFAPRPDVLVLNLHMPVMPGAELLEEVRRHPTLGRMPVILVTGAAVPADVGSAADAVLTKPFDLEHLVAALEGLAGRGTSPPPPAQGGGP